MKKLIGLGRAVACAMAVVCGLAASAAVSPDAKTSKMYISNGLVAQWDGIENAGVGVHDNATQTWTDLTGNGWDAKNGMNVQDLRWNANSFTFIRNWSWTFYVEKQNLVPSLGETFTIEAFVKPTANYAQDNAGVFGAHNDGGMGLSGFQYGGGLTSVGTWPRVLFRMNGFSPSDYMPAGECVRLVAQLDGEARTATAYANGDEPVESVPYIDGTDATFTNPNFYIGNAYDGSGGRMFDGEIYTVRVYNRILTPEELAYNNGVDLYRFCDDPSKFMDLEATTAYDPATKQLTVSALLKQTVDPQDLSVVLTGVDGTATTNVIRKGATVSATPYSITLGDLPADSTLSATLLAVNTTSGMAVTRALDVFYTGAISVVAGADADAENGSDGYFTVSRGDSAAATAYPLTVKYTVGGTAVGGTDYVALSGTVTIPAGASSAQVGVVQLVNPDAGGDKTLSLTLAEGLYAIDDAAASAQIAVKPLTSCWTYDATTRQMTDGDWVFEMGCDGTKLWLNRLVTQGQSSVLKLNTPINDGAYRLHSIANALQNNDFVTEVRLPNTLSEIGAYAFYNCANLEKVSPAIPKSVTHLGEQCFRVCPKLACAFTIGDDESETPVRIDYYTFVSSPEIPKFAFKANVTDIPVYFAPDCAMLQEIEFSEGLKTIGEVAFCNASRLKKVTNFLPSTVTYVGRQAFDLTKRLTTSLTLGCGEGADVTLAEYCFRYVGSPEVTLGPRVKVLPAHAFQAAANLRRVTAHDDITSLGDEAFESCSYLEEFLPSPAPASLTYLGHACFFNCTSLGGEVVLGRNGSPVTLAGEHNYRVTKVSRVDLGPGVTSIPNCFCYDNKSLKSLSMGDSQVTEIGYGAFQGDSGIEGVINLPETLTRINYSAFQDCSGITEFEPFVPESVTWIGAQAFWYCTGLQKGVLKYALSGVEASMDQYPFEGSAIKEAHFGNGISAIPTRCCQSCPELAYVKLPDSVTTIGESAFNGCPKLKTVEPFLPASLTWMGASFSSCPALAGELTLGSESDEADPFTFGGYSFLDDTSLGDVTIGKNVAMLPYLFFRSCAAVKTVYFLGDTEWNGEAFNNWGSYKARFVVDKQSAYWDSFVADESKCRLPTPEELQTYRTTYPGEPDPRGLTVIAPANQWIISYGMVEPGQKDLTVAGKPDLFAPEAVSPKYGLYKDTAASLPATMTAPRYAETNEVLYECLGYVVETPAVKGWGHPETNWLSGAGERSVSFGFDEDGARRFSWLWVPAGFQSEIRLPEDSSIGSVTCSDPGLEGYYASGTTATFTAVPGEDITFVRWHGDVPEDQAYNPTITLTMDGKKTLQPEFASPWVYSTTGGIWNGPSVCDGYWTLNASVDGEGNYTVGSPVVSDKLGIIDLTKPIKGGGRFTTIVGGAFWDNRTVFEIRLPETLTTVGENAFRNCAIERIVPFLPDSVTFVGNAAFYQSHNLAGTFRFGFGGPSELSGGSHFCETIITEVRLGEGVTVIPGGCFQSCGSLTNVVVTDNITTIGESAFRELGNLRTFTPLMPASLTSLANTVFYHCGKLSGNLTLGLGGEPITFFGGNQFAGTSITNVVLGGGVTNIPGSFAEGCATRAVSMTDSVKSVAGYAFKGCGNLESVRLSGTLEEIGDWAFAQCGKLKTVEPLLPPSLKRLTGNYQFLECGALTGPVNLENRKHSLALDAAYGMFVRNGALREVVVGREIAETPGEFFSSCAGVRHFYLKTRTAFGASAFTGWTDRQAVVFVPRDNAEWMADIRDTALCTPWAEVNRDLQDEYRDKFPGEKEPFGLLTTDFPATYAPPRQWVRTWNPNATGTKLIFR